MKLNELKNKYVKWKADRLEEKFTAERLIKGVRENDYKYTPEVRELFEIGDELGKDISYYIVNNYIVILRLNGKPILTRRPLVDKERIISSSAPLIYFIDLLEKNNYKYTDKLIEAIDKHRAWYEVVEVVVEKGIIKHFEVNGVELVLNAHRWTLFDYINTILKINSYKHNYWVTEAFNNLNHMEGIEIGYRVLNGEVIYIILNGRVVMDKREKEPYSITHKSRQTMILPQSDVDESEYCWTLPSGGDINL